MERLLKVLWHVSIEDAIQTENTDLQFVALKKLYDNIKNKDFYLPLIIANSIVCYQLSSTWEKYWDEFSKAASEHNFKEKKDILEFFKNFLPNSRWNKRFVETKINRLIRLSPFLDKFFWNEESYYENMILLQNELAKTMNQKKDDKTIVFAVKMFYYWARNYFWKIIEFPFEIEIPIDSRLTKIYELYNEDKDLNIKDFYKILSRKLNIPELHLDAIVWVNFEKITK
jgi:DNA-(apurinic or apyrimidinic site) lyase